MLFSKLFEKEILIRLQGKDAFVSTVKYGCFYSRRKVFDASRESTPVHQEEDEPSGPLLPPSTVPVYSVRWLILPRFPWA